MFELTDKAAKLESFNPRAEKHGDENKLAGDIKLAVTMGNGVLSHFDGKLREALYRKASQGEQQDLIDGQDALVAVRFPRLGSVKWDEDFPGYLLQIGTELGLADTIELVDVTLRKFSFQPLEGGSVAVGFSIICHPDPSEAGALCALIQEDVQVTLIPPTREESAGACEQTDDSGQIDAVAETMQDRAA